MKLILKFKVLLLLLMVSINGFSQNPKGKLFIIGGGNRSDVLMNQLLKITQLQTKDYIVVLPMSSEEPDSAYIYFKNQLEELTTKPIAMLNFDKEKTNNTVWIDSLQKAKLIYISGGDQSRFMNVVRKTPIYFAIKKAYQNGSTIAGTSAGAAVMSEKMITGNQKLNTKYSDTFSSIQHDNLEITEGLGLLKNVIIDQHFLKRSRYNRLISAMVEFPKCIGIGIDESTAIVVSNNEIEVVGESEVIVMKNPKGISKHKTNNLVSIDNVELKVLVEGQKFKLQ